MSNQYAYFSNVIRDTQVPLNYARRAGVAVGLLKGATEGSDNPFEPEVGIGGRVTKLATNALGGYIAGDLGARAYNNRSLLGVKVNKYKQDALAQLPTVTIDY